tara:strand:- start:866 stop:1438 length:573 start_codon:yes stop_codon:yes gene_type:complete
MVDPVSLGIVLGSKAINMGIDMYRTNQANKKADQMFEKIEETAGVIQDKYEDIFSIANYFKPGGAAWKGAVAESADVAFTTARKGQEDLLSKGINMTAYGTGVGTDVVTDQFMDNLITKKHEITKMGANWANVGAGLMGDWADMLSVGYKGQMDQALAMYSKKQSDTGSGMFLDAIVGEAGDISKIISGG